MGVKLGPMGYLFMKKKKIQNKNLQNYSNIYTPQTDASWGGGGYSHCAF